MFYLFWVDYTNYPSGWVNSQIVATFNQIMISKLLRIPHQVCYRIHFCSTMESPKIAPKPLSEAYGASILRRAGWLMVKGAGITMGSFFVCNSLVHVI